MTANDYQKQKEKLEKFAAVFACIRVEALPLCGFSGFLASTAP